MKKLNKIGLALIFAAASVGTFASANAQEVQPLMSSNVDLAPGQSRTEITGKVQSVGQEDVCVRSEDGKVYDVRLTAHSRISRGASQPFERLSVRYGTRSWSSARTRQRVTG